MMLPMLLVGISLTQCQQAVTNTSMDVDHGGPSSDAIYDAVALCEAAESGNLAIVERLVEKGVDADADVVKYIYNQPPLYIAAEKGHLAVVEYLVEKGANVNAAGLHGHPPYTQQ